MSGVERGRRNVSILAAIRISRALGVPLSVLLDEASNPPSESNARASYAAKRRQAGRRRGKTSQPLGGVPGTLTTPLAVPDQLVAVQAVSDLIRIFHQPAHLLPLRLGGAPRSSRQVAR